MKRRVFNTCIVLMLMLLTLGQSLVPAIAAGTATKTSSNQISKLIDDKKVINEISKSSQMPSSAQSASQTESSISSSRTSKSSSSAKTETKSAKTASESKSVLEQTKQPSDLSKASGVFFKKVFIQLEKMNCGI